MANFPNYSPVYPASKSSAPQMRTVKFGDGYEQRLTVGLHQNPKEWRLVFDVSDEDADIIETFLNERADDANSFGWVPPDSTTSYKWVCKNWDREMYDFQRSKINATFMQVFEP
jgi:phage-related protein